MNRTNPENDERNVSDTVSPFCERDSHLYKKDRGD